MTVMNRRDFMKGSIAMCSAACCSAAFGSLGSRVAWASTGGGNGKTIVVIHLDGGNDWHHSFDIPGNTSSRSAYEDARPNIQIPVGSILPTAGGHGLHPSLVSMKSMFDAGDVRIMRRVGTNDPSRSHGTEQMKFETGDSNAGLGWMGGVMDALASQGQLPGRFMTMSIGMGNPIDIQGASARGLGLRDVTSYGLNRQGSSDDQAYRQFISKSIIDSLSGSTPIVSAAKEGQQKMYNAIDTLGDANDNFTGRGLSNNPVRGQQYPTSRPGPQLRQIAMLIQAGLGTQLALCGMGGFDLHSGIGGVTGREADLMNNLDLALAAFRADMLALGCWDDVTVVVDSEFGRTIRQNGGQGTDHGESIALVAVGGEVRGGVTGAAVTGDEFLRNGGRRNWIPPEHHFANAYEELLSWAGLPTSGVFAPHSSHDFNIV